LRRLIDDAYQLAKRTLIANRDRLETIAKALLEYETLDGSQIKEIIDHGRLINPPPGIGPTPTTKLPDKPPKQVVAPDVAPPLPGALGGAPCSNSGGAHAAWRARDRAETSTSATTASLCATEKVCANALRSYRNDCNGHYAH